jgi:hypothetical protein
VVRLIFAMHRALTVSLRCLVFEQDDPVLWNQLIGIVTPYLKDIQSRRGLEAFNVVCDGTTNTPYNRNNNQYSRIAAVVDPLVDLAFGLTIAWKNQMKTFGGIDEEVLNRSKPRE